MSSNLPNIKKEGLGSRRKPSVDLNSMMYGKVPPQATDLEEAILGAIMIEKGAFDQIVEIIKKPECFYVEAHQKIFAACMSLADKNSPIDILTVVQELRLRGEIELVGGAFYISKLTNMVASTANKEVHAQIVLQKYVQRELIKMSGVIISEAFEDTTDVFDLLDDAEQKLFSITNNYLKSDYDDIVSAMASSMERIDKLREQKDEISGVPSGFHSLDQITYGWQPSDLIILAARPAVGKTAFALNLIRNAALHPTKPTPVAFFSLEMSASQLVNRILSAESEIKLEKISRGKMEDYEYHQLQSHGINRLDKAKIFIDDTAALNIFELRAKARRLVSKEGVGMIVIDYLQLMTGSKEKNGNREQEISGISRNLKVMAKELNIPIIALSQLSRAVESRKESNKVPQLSDLRESGAIEQDADMVMFIYRPEYYGIENNEMGESVEGLTEVKIAKHRNGSLGDVKFIADLSIQKFNEFSTDNTFRKFRNIQSAGNGGNFTQLPSRMNDFDENMDFGESPF